MIEISGDRAAEDTIPIGPPFGNSVHTKWALGVSAFTCKHINGCGRGTSTSIQYRQSFTRVLQSELALCLRMRDRIRPIGKSHRNLPLGTQQHPHIRAELIPGSSRGFRKVVHNIWSSLILKSSSLEPQHSCEHAGSVVTVSRHVTYPRPYSTLNSRRHTSKYFVE